MGPPKSSLPLVTLGAVAVLAALALTGCESTGSVGAPVTPAPPSAAGEFSPTVIMRCGDEQYYLDTSGLAAGGDLPVRVSTVDGAAYLLPQVESADGAKYSDGALTLWNKGADWMEVDEATGTSNECVLAAIGG